MQNGADTSTVQAEHTTDQRDATVSSCSMFNVYWWQDITARSILPLLRIAGVFQGGILSWQWWSTYASCTGHPISGIVQYLPYSQLQVIRARCTGSSAWTTSSSYWAPFIRALCYIWSMSYKMVRSNKYIRSLRYPVYFFLYHSILWQPVSYTV